MVPQKNRRTLSVHDDMQHGLTFQKASAPFEMSVLPYSAYELENAMHLDELPACGGTDRGERGTAYHL